MASGGKHLKPLRRRMRGLLNAERSRMCWELGHFQAPMFIKEPGKTPSKPYMLVCIDTASMAIMGSDLLLDTPTPQDLLSLLVASMEEPCVGIGAPVLPESARLDDPAAFPELKHVILVDEDVNIFDTNDVLWAMTTRYQGDVSTVFIPGVRCHPLDPSQSPDFSPSIPVQGTSCKTIFDCTVPFPMKDRFRRAEFVSVDLAKFSFSDYIAKGSSIQAVPE